MIALYNSPVPIALLFMSPAQFAHHKIEDGASCGYMLHVCRCLISVNMVDSKIAGI